MRHAVLGPGGVGALIGAALARSGETVVLLVRPGSIDAYPGHIRVESRVLGVFEVEVPAADQLEAGIDALWVTPKATALESALTLAPSETVDDAVVIPMLNGIDHVDLLRKRYRHVIAGAIRVESERDAAWVVHQRSPFLRVDLGPAGDEISAKLRGAGVDCVVREDEASLLWDKLAILAPLALTTTALGEPLGGVRSDPGWLSRLERAQREVVTVARAEGVEVDEASLRAMYASAPDTTRSSMQKDVAAGREPELDAIAGPILRAGERHRIDVSATRELAALVTANRRPGDAPGRTA